MLLAVGGGVLNGVFNVWTGNLYQILSATAHNSSHHNHTVGADEALLGLDYRRASSPTDLSWRSGDAPSVYSSTRCGWIGFATTVALMVGGLCIGPLADRPPWNRRMKAMLVAFGTLTALAMVSGVPHRGIGATLLEST